MKTNIDIIKHEIDPYVGPVFTQHQRCYASAYSASENEALWLDSLFNVGNTLSYDIGASCRLHRKFLK